MRQLVIVRKDLGMSIGKLAAQVSHASMAFLTNKIRGNGKKLWKHSVHSAYKLKPTLALNGGEREKVPMLYKRADLSIWAKEAFERGEDFFTTRPVNPDQPYGELELCENEYDKYVCDIVLDKETYEEWVMGIFTKTICGAKNRNQLLKAVTLAEEQGLKDGVDFFLIKDNCLTELEPEEYDNEGVGRTLTCIGFRPLPDDVAHAISKKYQLLK